MNIPIHLPLLHRYHTGEDEISRSHRHASLAKIVVFADACTDHGHGLGYYLPLYGWNTLDIPDLNAYYSTDGLLHDVDINILEFIAVIFALCATIRMLFLDHMHDNDTHTHIHIWTDNQSCRSWMIKHRANHPLHSFLLQLYVLIQVQHRVTVTVGHYPGCINVYADAASRKFQVPQGEQYRMKLDLLPILPYPSRLISDIVAIANTPSVSTSSLARNALISLGGVHGWITQKTIGSILD
jgi:hypothetical protein